MFIRSKVARGQTYYQVVEGQRVGGTVRQRVVVALGTRPTVAEALEFERARLTRLRRKWRGIPADSASPPLRRQLESLDRRMAAAAERIGVLERVGELLAQQQAEPSPVVPTSGGLDDAQVEELADLLHDALDAIGDSHPAASMADLFRALELVYHNYAEITAELAREDEGGTPDPADAPE